MNRLALARIVTCLVFGASLSSFAQTKGIDALPPEDQQIVKGLEFKSIIPAPLDQRRFTYIKGEMAIVNSGPQNSIVGKLHVQMSMLFVNKDRQWVVVNCGDIKFAVTTQGQESVHLSSLHSNKLFETFLRDKKAIPVATRSIVKYGDVVIYEEPLNPVAASAPEEWWSKPTGVLGPADDAAIAAQNAVSNAAPQVTSKLTDASSKAGEAGSKPSSASAPASASASVSAAKPSATTTSTMPFSPGASDKTVSTAASATPVAGQAAASAALTPPSTRTTATTPAVATIRVASQPPPPNAASPPQQGLILDRYWASPMQGGKAAMQELGTLLSPFAQPAANVSPSPGLKLFEEVTYLMPYAEARKKLNLNQRIVPKAKVECAGFPRDSFSSYAFDGVFEGHFNKLYLVTDKADQVVAVQLVTGNPNRTDVDAPYYPTDGHTYNFINSRAKAITRLWVDHKPYFQGKDGWRKYDPKSSGTYGQPSGEVGLLRIDSLLMDPKPDSTRNVRGSNWKALEAVRLYLPKPMMEIILHCIRGVNR